MQKYRVFGRQDARVALSIRVAKLPGDANRSRANMAKGTEALMAYFRNTPLSNRVAAKVRSEEQNKSSSQLTK